MNRERKKIMRFKLAAVSSVLLAVGVLVPMAQSQTHSNVHQVEANKAWQSYVKTGHFGPIHGNPALQYLWHDHVKMELKNPRFQTVGMDWSNKMFYSWVPGAFELSGVDAIFETVQLLPIEVLEVIGDADERMEGGSDRMAQILAATPERMEATVDMLAGYSDGDNPFVGTYADLLRRQASDPGKTLGAASLAELHAMTEAGLIATERPESAGLFDRTVEAVQESKKQTGTVELTGPQKKDVRPIKKVARKAVRKTPKKP
jgi:hypothetical protein